MQDGLESLEQNLAGLPPEQWKARLSALAEENGLSQPLGDKHFATFIDQGNTVKVTIMFRGRELAHRELGSQMLDRVAEEVQEEAVVEQRPAKMDGRFMIMLLAPKSDK